MHRNTIKTCSRTTKQSNPAQSLCRAIVALSVLFLCPVVCRLFCPLSCPLVIICTGWRLLMGWFSLPHYLGSRVPRGHLSLRSNNPTASRDQFEGHVCREPARYANCENMGDSHYQAHGIPLFWYVTVYYSIL